MQEAFVRGEPIGAPVAIEDGDEFIRAGVLLRFRCFLRGEASTGTTHSTLPIDTPSGGPEESRQE